MVFSRRTICVAPMLVGALLLLSAAHMLGQQSSQNPKQQAQTTSEPSQARPGNSGRRGTGPQSSSQHSSSDTKHSKGAASAASAPNRPAVSNPFPMAQSEAAEKADEQKSQDNGKTSATQANPFPEAQSKSAAKEAGNENSGTPKAGTSSSSGGYSSSDANLPAPDVGQGKLGSHEKMDSFTRDQTLDGRIEDDLNVADFYSKNGNYRGASLRYQDALQYDPQNDTAQYGLAETMCKENLTSQAMDHFKSYVANHPRGQYVKKAEKMLADPKKCQHNR